MRKRAFADFLDEGNSPSMEAAGMPPLRSCSMAAWLGCETC